jgi:transcriptional regulator with XRE-family HTH domain
MKGPAEMNEERRGTIGKNIKRFREEKKLSQSQLAKQLWIERTSLAGYERGQRLPDIFMLCKIADILEISLDVLTGREGVRKDG